MNRREFVASSSAMAVALTYRALPASFLAESLVSSDVAWVLFDQRFGASQGFGLAASGLDQRTYGIDGDVTAFWTEHLDPLWRGGAGAVAGMTTATSLVCIEQLAAQHWFRVIARVEHLPAGERTISHRISAEPQWLQRLRGGLTDPALPRHFATALLTPGRRRVRAEEAEFSTGTHWNWLDTPPLISWYIAGRTMDPATIDAATSRPEVEI